MSNVILLVVLVGVACAAAEFVRATCRRQLLALQSARPSAAPSAATPLAASGPATAELPIAA